MTSDGRVSTLSRPGVPESLRNALVMVALFGLLAAALGLFMLSTARDQAIEAAEEHSRQLGATLVDQREVLLTEDATGLLAELVLSTGDLRGAVVRLGATDRVVAVGQDVAAPTDAEVSDAVAAGEPVAVTTDSTVRVLTAFARVEGEPAVLATVAPIEPPRIGWTGIVLGWAIVSVGILAMSLLLERGRRDRMGDLQDALQALSARDAIVTRQQQDLQRTKNDFINAISQELRGPLQVIKGVASLMARGGRMTEEQQRDLVAGLQLNADRLDALMVDLIDVDRLTERTVPVRRTEVPVDRALDAVLEGIDTSQHVVVRETGDVVAHVTPAHLERILRALLLNAVKYSPPGSSITVRATRSARLTTLVVEDEGPGIPIADRLTVFEPLRQLRNDSGVGLGLALVKRFAELHGGRAWAEEAPGGGAAFHVVLPDDGEDVVLDTWRVTAQVDGEALSQEAGA